jgi:hypothetical protein
MQLYTSAFSTAQQQVTARHLALQASLARTEITLSPRPEDLLVSVASPSRVRKLRRGSPDAFASLAGGLPSPVPEERLSTDVQFGERRCCVPWCLPEHMPLSSCVRGDLHDVGVVCEPLLPPRIFSCKM